MQQNETKESEAYCCDVNCYCRRQNQQESINKEANDVNKVSRENIAINVRQSFKKTNLGNDKIFAGFELCSSMSTKQPTQRWNSAMNKKK